MNDAKKIVLARRARFVAAAIASAGLAAGCKSPQPCLSIDPGFDAAGEVDASPGGIPPDAGRDASTDAGREGGADAGRDGGKKKVVVVDAGPKELWPLVCLSPSE